MRPAIHVDNLSKQYRIGTRRRSVDRDLRETITDGVKGLWRQLRRAQRVDETKVAEEGEFWALKDVSFDVQPGEVVGIIGRNGAGKSTLLKILSRIVEPTSGRAEIRGRMGSLLEVGTGFHPELTGRENIYLNGSILGMSRKEIDRKFDEIVAFSEIEKFLDTPVKRYSSGMFVRLAFAVMAHLEPEILILDEVLAVGDLAFQKKCLGKIGNVSNAGRTVLFVSHNLAAVERLCERTVLLEQGEMRMFASTSEALQCYLAASPTKSDPTVDLESRLKYEGQQHPALRQLVVESAGKATSRIRMGDSVRFTIQYALAKEPTDLRLGIVLEDSYGTKVLGLSPTFQFPTLLAGAPPQGKVQCTVPCLSLVEGTYLVNVHCQTGLAKWECVEKACEIEVISADIFGTGNVPSREHGLCYLESSWTTSWEHT